MSAIDLPACGETRDEHRCFRAVEHAGGHVCMCGTVFDENVVNEWPPPAQNTKRD